MQRHSICFFLHTFLPAPYCTALPTQIFALTYPACTGGLSLRSLCALAHSYSCKCTYIPACKDSIAEAPETALATISCQRVALSTRIAKCYACFSSNIYAAEFQRQALNFDRHCGKHTHTCVQPHTHMHANAFKHVSSYNTGRRMRDKSLVT